MKKQIFKAGLGDMNIRQLHAQSGRRIHDLRNERTAAAGVEIGSAIFRRTDFSHARERAEALQQRRGVMPKTQAQKISAGDGSLEFSGRAGSDDPPMIDDGKPLT